MTINYVHLSNDSAECNGYMFCMRNYISLYMYMYRVRMYMYHNKMII